jgi:flagellar hook-associated protein 3 FlgL
MAINSISYSGSLFGQAVTNLNNQLTNLATQLATGEKSTTYSGMGINEGFAVAARSQLSNISAFTNTITNLTTIIDSANTALQSLTSTAGNVQGAASGTPQTIDSTGQTVGQENAQSEFTSMIGILNTQVGDRYIFSGSAINTPSTASADAIMNGTSTLAGLKQVIAERAQADGTTGLGRLVISSPTTTGTAPATTTSFSVSEDAAGSPFGLKLSSVSSSSSGVTVSGPSGSPESVSFSLGSTNPSPGDQVTLTFNLPDGTTTSVQLTASDQNPPPAGSYSIATTSTGAPDPATTAANLNAALNTAIGTVANTTLAAASAVVAGNQFFDPSSSATGAVADNQAGAPITAATALSGASGDALAAGFQNGDTITVDGTTISFSSTAATSTSGSPYVINTTSGKVSDLLSAIDSITGTTTPSSVDGGAVTLNTPNAASFSVSTSSPGAQAALAALGFGPSNADVSTTTAGTTTTTTITAPQPPLRVSTAGSVTGAAATDQQAPAQPITGATALSGSAPSASLSAAFADGDTITVDGTTISFSSTATTSTSGSPYVINTGGTVSDLLSAINSITGGTSSISGGAITINTPNAANFSITATSSTAQAALGALGFSSASGTATSTAGGTNITANATTLVNGSSNTVAWYTGNNSSDPRASANAMVDSGISVQYGMQANEQAIRQQLEGVAVYAAVTVSPTGTNSPAEISALSSRISTNLISQPGQQQISDIQTDLANAQTTMQAAGARQTQSQTVLQNMVDDTETVSTEQVASQILAIQNALSASYQTTSMLSQLTLTKFLSGGL